MLLGYRDLLRRQYPRHPHSPLIESLNDSEHTGPWHWPRSPNLRTILKNSPDIIQEIKDKGLPLKLVFLETTESTLIQRYSEVSRPHPMNKGNGLEDDLERTLSLALYDPIG